MVTVEKKQRNSPNSLHKGVFKCGRRFKVQIQVDGIQYYLGVYDTALEATEAYQRHSKIASQSAAIRDSTLLQDRFPSGCDTKAGQRKTQRYSGVGDRLSKMQAQDIIGSKPITEDLPLTGEVSADIDTVTITSIIDSLLCQSSIVSLPTIKAIPNQTTDFGQYFVGVLSYDHHDRSYSWLGTWLFSDCGKPPISDFVKSLNYFEFHSEKVPMEEVLGMAGHAYVTADGTVVGLLKFCSTRFNGFTMFRTLKGTERQIIRDLQLNVTPVRDGKGRITQYNVSTDGEGLKGQSICSPALSGKFCCDTGLLEMARKL